jgi:hypothetical protein
VAGKNNEFTAMPRQRQACAATDQTAAGITAWNYPFRIHPSVAIRT